MDLIIGVLLVLPIWFVLSAWLTVLAWKLVGPPFTRLVDRTEAWYKGK
jgi:hypothetical protein